MSYYYFLVCMECKAGVLLGKRVWAKYELSETYSYGFASLGSMRKDRDTHVIGEEAIWRPGDAGSWKPHKDCVAQLEHFLMLHRTHELRVLPDTVEKYVTIKGFPHSYPFGESEAIDEQEYSEYRFFNTKVGEPDPVKEADDLPEELIERLRKF